MGSPEPTRTHESQCESLAEAYAFLIAIARRTSLPDADAPQEADENRAVDEAAKEIAA